VADEVYFVIQGGFTKYVDLSDIIKLPNNLIDTSIEAFNVPYVPYVKGSYFGDSDCFFQENEVPSDNPNNNGGESKVAKIFRDSTVEADNFNRVSVVMVIKKRHFQDEMKKFP